MRKNPREKGMPSITKLLNPFKIGESVTIRVEPSVHKGMPHHRFQGLTGKIIEKRGESYVVQIRDRHKPKQIIARPVHLTRVKL